MKNRNEEEESPKVERWKRGVPFLFGHVYGTRRFYKQAHMCFLSLDGFSRTRVWLSFQSVSSAYLSFHEVKIRVESFLNNVPAAFYNL